MPPPSIAALGFEHKVIVGIAEMVVSNNPSAILTTYSLGSCLGIAIFDPVARAGGLLHLMLPDSGIDAAKASSRPAMFVDTGVPALFRAAYQLGVDKSRTLVHVAGGAQIMDASGFFNIGKRNVEAFTALMQQHRLPLASQEVGGLVNRTLYLHLATGEVRLKRSGSSTDTILWKS